MTTFEKLKQIEADIAALPAEYQDLFNKEQGWASRHPYLYGVALVLAGFGLFGLILKVFGV